MARLLISSGEASGDLYAAELVRHLAPVLPGLEAFGLGGDRLAAQGARLLAHARELAVVGLLEVVTHLTRIRRIFHRVLDEVDRKRPDAAVLIDYPDFNLRLARKLAARGVPVLYYVSPQVWAWRRGRLRAIKETVSRMIVIFPFEEPLYRQAGIPVSFVGHPLVDARWGVAFGILETIAWVGAFVAPLAAGRLYEIGPARPFQIGLALMPVALLLTYLFAPRAGVEARENLAVAAPVPSARPEP